MSDTLKELPSAPTKAKIQEMYANNASGYTNNFMRSQMNTILIADGFSIRQKFLTCKQFKELVEILGPPPGYKELKI